MTILAYTFRTFSLIPELKSIFGDNLSVFGKLKQDIDLFCKKIIQFKPEFILGIAISKSNFSTLEQFTTNSFNKNKKILDNSPEFYNLFIPNLKNLNFKINSTPKTTFCNYSAYLIQNFLEKNKISTHFSFIHIKKEQIDQISVLLEANDFKIFNI